MGATLTNSGAVQKEWVNISRKVMTDITSTGGAVMPALKLIYGENPRQYSDDLYEFERNYSTKGSIPQVLRGGDYITISGEKKVLVQFDPQIYKVKGGYGAYELQTRSRLTGMKESKEKFRMPIMRRSIVSIQAALNDWAIMSRYGGVVATPVITDNGEIIYTDQNYGLIWSDSVGTGAFPTKMQDGVTMTNVDWGNASTSLATIEKNIGFILKAAEDKGLTPMDMDIQVGATTFDEIAAKIDAYTGTSKRNASLNYSVNYIDGIIMLGGKKITYHNYSTVVNSTTYKFVEDKYITVCLKPQYNDWVYMPVEDVNALYTPILFWHKETESEDNDKFYVKTQSRQFLCPDVNGIFTVKVVS